MARLRTAVDAGLTVNREIDERRKVAPKDMRQALQSASAAAEDSDPDNYGRLTQEEVIRYQLRGLLSHGGEEPEAADQQASTEEEVVLELEEEAESEAEDEAEEEAEEAESEEQASAAAPPVPDSDLAEDLAEGLAEGLGYVVGFGCDEGVG